MVDGDITASVSVSVLIYPPIDPQDCASAPYTSSSDNFPSAKLNYQGIMEYFATEFGSTPLEVRVTIRKGWNSLLTVCCNMRIEY